MKPSTALSGVVALRGGWDVRPPRLIEHLSGGDAGWRLRRCPAGPARAGGRTRAHVTEAAGNRRPRRSGRDERDERGGPGPLSQTPRSGPRGTCCTRSLLWRQPAHQRAKLRADLLDLLGLLGLAALEEGGLAAVELLDQLASEGAVLDLA